MRKKAKDSYLLTPLGTTQEQLKKKLHSFEGRLAETISNWTGSINFVYFHIFWFGSWIVINTGYFPEVNKYIPIFDPFPFGLLTMIVSLEAIFLTTFILINQNRQALVDTYRELEEEEEEKEEEKEQEELEEDVQDIQKDLDDIKNAMIFIQQKINDMEKNSNPKS